MPESPPGGRDCFCHAVARRMTVAEYLRLLTTSFFAAKVGVSNTLPDAIGKTAGLTGRNGSVIDKHGKTQVIDCIEAHKDEDIGIIKSRV